MRVAAIQLEPVVGDVGEYQGHAMICGADGTVLADRAAEQGPGIVVADVTPRRIAPADRVPDRFWLQRRGVITAGLWTYQNAHGRRWYRKHAVGRATAD